MPDGATVMIGGFGTAGMPNELIDALIEQGAQRPHHRQQQRRQRRHRPRRAAQGAGGCARSSARFRARPTRHVFDALYRAGKIELELVPQGNLAERIRAAGAGIGAFFTPDRLRHRARRGQGDARDRRPQVRARVPDPRRLRADQGRARRPLGQPRLPQDRAQLRADHGDGGASCTIARCTRSSSSASSTRRPSSRRASSCSAIVKVDRVATQAGGFKQAA